MINREKLQPGHLELVEFLPSNKFAFVNGVSYNVTIAPSHDMMTSTRVVLTMPEHLIFNRQFGCSISYTPGQCTVHPTKNELTLSNVFKERTPGGTIIKFVVSFADNPRGARYAGDWGARTEGIFNGEYFIVDGNDNGRSFDALPGYILSTVSTDESMTFTEDASLDFTFETEHDV